MIRTWLIVVADGWCWLRKNTLEHGSSTGLTRVFTNSSVPCDEPCRTVPKNNTRSVWGQLTRVNLKTIWGWASRMGMDRSIFTHRQMGAIYGRIAGVESTHTYHYHHRCKRPTIVVITSMMNQMNHHSPTTIGNILQQIDALHGDKGFSRLPMGLLRALYSFNMWTF